MLLCVHQYYALVLIYTLPKGPLDTRGYKKVELQKTVSMCASQDREKKMD